MSGDLTRWAEEEGVLLLNCALTVGAKKKDSHLRDWKDFTDRVIKLLSDKRDNLVFLLWGRDAQAKANPRARLIDRSRHCVLPGYHPTAPGDLFFGCRHFSRTNDCLRRQGLPPIDWRP